MASNETARVSVEIKGRERWLMEAEALLGEGGPRAVTVQGMAARLGVSAPALYKHFSGRDALIEALSARGWQRFHEALSGCLRKRTPSSRLLDCGERYVRFGLSEPQTYRLLFSSEEARARSPRADEPERGPGLVLVGQLIGACQRAGKLPSRVRTEDLAIAYWATCHGLVSLYLDGGADRRFGRQAYEQLTRRALRGLSGA